MFSWSPYSFIRIAIVYTAGVLAGIYYPELISPLPAILIFLGCSFMLIGSAVIRFFYGRKTMFAGLIGLTAVFFAGNIRVYNATDSNHSNHILHIDSIRSYKAVIISASEEKENSWKAVAQVRTIQGNDYRWVNKAGKVLLYFSKKDFQKPFQYGDVLLMEGSPQELSGPANPGEFDYKRFLTFRKIYHQQYLQENSVLYLGNEPPNLLMKFGYHARDWADEKLRKYVSGVREQAIASALVLGVTDGLDNDLLGAYAATGAMHVLAVSGLHVGIIYMLLSFLLKPLQRIKRGKWILAGLSIFVLWVYAIVTGLSPSVLRAVTMFSFVVLAKPWGQRTNIYNTLAASAFCLMVVEPYLIMSVGFQLSYLAVIGIVYLQPMLYRAWEPRSLLLDKVWQITCVSIAAQVATFSLGLLYFHQFPVYFLFSNLFVIPGSFAILVLGLAVIVSSAIVPVAVALGFLLEWIIRIVNWGVFMVEAFPYSLINHVYITTAQCWLLILSILSIFMLIEFRKFSFVIITSICILWFTALQWEHFSKSFSQQKFTVYKVAGQSAFEIISGGNSFVFMDSALLKNEERMRFHIMPNRLQNGVRKQQRSPDGIVKELAGCRMISYNGYKILHIYHKQHTFPEFMKVDYLVISRNAIGTMASLSTLKYKTLILDSSNSLYISEKIMNEAKATSSSVYSVIHGGAFVATL